jgi:hypothetical protein
MFMHGKPVLLLFFCILLITPSYALATVKDVAGNLPVKAYGTGMTTGHIADLVIRNKSKTVLNILPQRVFIPSEGHYQPYIADIPATIISPGSTDTLSLTGYCTDFYRPAAPAHAELLPVLNWIPIRQPNTSLVDTGTYLINHNSVVPFTKDHIGYIITSTAYTPLYPPPDPLNIATWPGTDLVVNGTLNPISRPDLYATVMARVLELLESGSTTVQQRKTFSTPYTVQPVKEREAIIQQMIWMYAAALAGKKYGKEEFSNKVYDEFKSHTSLTEIPTLEKQELDDGIAAFWNVFQTVIREAGLFNSTEQLTVTGILADLPIDTIQYPWSKVMMTDILMKPGFVKYIPDKVSNPVLPIIAGATSLTSLLLIAFHEHSGDTNCVFSVTLKTTAAACGHETGTITLTTNIEADYTYIWSTGATTKNLVGVGPGVYSVTVTRNTTTCSATAEATVGNIDLPVNTTIGTTDAHCGQSDGTASVTVDPPGAYTYAWSNGSMDQNQLNLPAGDYTVTVTASGTCADTNSVTIQNLPPSFVVTISTTPEHCGMTDGTAHAEVEPPGDYLFAWSDGSMNNSVSGLPAGSYSLTVTESGTGCTITQESTVEDSTSAISISASTTDATCGMKDGSASITTDPPGEYTYVWSDGQDTPEATGLAPGTYSVTVAVPGTGCSDSLQITIGELPPAYIISTSAMPASCGEEDGTVNVTVDPPGNYEYHWSNGQSGTQLTDLAPGNYVVSVSLAGNLCQQTAEVMVNELPPTFTLSSNTTNAGCGLQDGTAEIIADPPGEYTYEWSNGQTSAQISGLAAGSYEVTVSIPGSTCAQNLSITVNQDPPSFTVTLSASLTHCGLSDGSATAMVDPPDEYEYLWSNGQTGNEITGLAEGTYTVTVSLAGTSCLQVMSVMVDQEPASFTLNTMSAPAHCGMNDGSATVQVDPPGEYMYQWSGGQTVAELTGIPSGQYIVSVSLVGSACFVSDTVIVDQVPLSLNGSFNITPADCGVANGSAEVTIDPNGNYGYAWSNGQSGNMLQQVLAGNYDVTVTDDNSCTATFSTAIGENAAHYLDISGITPATCLGGGEILFTLSGPGGGNFAITVNAPGGPVSFNLGPGSYMLSSFTSIIPGEYNFMVYDQSIGMACMDHQAVQVDDQTPAISLMNDSYTTQSEVPVSGNVLLNDSGLNLQLTALENIIGGNVSFMNDGSFTYTPNTGFSGMGSFVYTATDACGNSASGTAVINVQMVACTITISSTLTPANCDLNNGAIAVSVNEPGNYQYLWSTGQTGSSISSIPAGMYTVTITETGSGCMQDFTLNLTEYPADYISNVVITQPSCTNDGEIQFILNTQGSAPYLTVSVDYPNGFQSFTIEPGLVVLSDYVDIVEGNYSIEAFIGDAGPDCIDDLSATINAAPSVAIAAGQIFPPSSQGAMDGAVNMSITDPGISPYSIYVNDGFYGTTSSLNFQVTGLMTGFYDIYVVDAAGCVSNTVMVIIPLPNSIFSMGIALTGSSVSKSNEQPAHYTSALFRTGFEGSLRYHFGRHAQRLRMLYTSRFSDSRSYYPALLQVEHLSSMAEWHKKQLLFSVNGGVGWRSVSGLENVDPAYMMLNAGAELNWRNFIHLEAELSLRGWSVLEPPAWMFIISFPFLKQR